MYRIIFNPTTAKWQLQLQVWGVFWTTVKTNPIGFENFDLADDYVKKIGLDNVYRNYASSPVHEIMSGFVPAVVHSDRRTY